MLKCLLAKIWCCLNTENIFNRVTECIGCARMQNTVQRFRIKHGVSPKKLVAVDKVTVLLLLWENNSNLLRSALKWTKSIVPKLLGTNYSLRVIIGISFMIPMKGNHLKLRFIFAVIATIKGMGCR